MEIESISVTADCDRCSDRPVVVDVVVETR